MDFPAKLLLALIVLVMVLAAISACQIIRKAETSVPLESQIDPDVTTCTIKDVSDTEMGTVARLLLSLNGKGRFGSLQGSLQLSGDGHDFRSLSDQLAVLLRYDDVNEVPDGEIHVAQFCNKLTTDTGFRLLLLRYPEVLEEAFNGYHQITDPVLEEVSREHMPTMTTIQIIHAVATRQTTATDRLTKAKLPNKELTVMAEWLFGCAGYGHATFNNDMILPITEAEPFNDIIFGMAQILGYDYVAALPDAATGYKWLVQKLVNEQHCQHFLDLLIEFGDFLTALKQDFDEQVARDPNHTIVHFVPDSATFVRLRKLHADYAVVIH